VSRIENQERGLVWVDLPGLAPPWHIDPELAEAYFDEEEEELGSPWLDPPVGPLDDADGTAWSRLQNTYAAVVTAFDAQLGSVFDELRDRDLWDHLLVCVTASCGLALGEHGYVGPYRAWMHEESVHLPLISKMPGASDAGLRVSALTQPHDLMATLLESLGVDATPGLPSLMRGEATELRPHICSGRRIGDSSEWLLRTPEWAFLLPLQIPAGDPPRPPQLYVKPDDRWEINDVRNHHLELAEQFEQTLRAVAEGHR
jgi:hypothetical protein